MHSIADKISRLIAKADSSTHPEEADTFMAKVHSMLQQHGLTMLELGTLQTDDPVGITEDAASYTPVESSYRDTCFMAARYYGCEATIGKRRLLINDKFVYRYSATVYGRQNARTTFELMWPYLKRAMFNAAAELKKQDKLTYGKARSYSVYMRHVSTALQFRMREAIYAREAINSAPTTGVNALVPVDLIDQIMPDGLKVVRKTKKETTAAAVKAAAGIGLDFQVHAHKGPAKQIESN